MKKILSSAIFVFLQLSVFAQQNSLTPSQQNLGNGYFEINANQRGQHGDILVGDIDNDGDLDLIVGGEQRFSPWMYQGGTYFNDGTGKFTQMDPSRNLVTPGGYSYMDFGDIDGDGFMDIIYCGVNNQGTKSHNGIAINDGKGLFIPSETDKYPMPPNRSTYCAFGDFNNDGLLDYFFAGTFTSFGSRDQSYAAIYFQHENGSFIEDRSSFTDYPLTDAICSIVDFDNDGFLDIFVTGFLDTQDQWPVCPYMWARFTVPFRNMGDGKFEPIDISNRVFRKGFGSLDWADIDGNGYLDFIQYGESYPGEGEDSQYKTRIYKQLSPGIFKEAYMYDGARPFSMGGAVVLQDFDNDGDTDVLFGGWCPNLPGGARQKTFIFINDDKDNNLTKGDLKENNFLSNIYLPGMSEQDFEVADFNGDFKLDYVYLGFAGGESGNPVHPNRNIFGWSPTPENKEDLLVLPYIKLSEPTNLNASVSGEGFQKKVTFSWNEPHNNIGRKSTTYNLALRNLNTGRWLYNPLSIIGGEKDGWRQVNEMGNVNLNKRWTLTLPDGQYEWSVQAVDASHFGGFFAPFQTINITTSVNEINLFNPLVYSKENILYIENCPIDEEVEMKIFLISGISLKGITFRGFYSTPISKGVYVIEIKTKKESYVQKLLVI